MSQIRLSCLILIIISTIHTSKQASSPESPTYVAGVVEFKPSIFKYKNETSAPDYLSIIYSEEAKPVDIIVFPEMTLNTLFTITYVPQPKKKIIPCKDDTYEEFFRRISCAAIITGKYIVININEKANCSHTSEDGSNDPRPCAADGLNKYNTNVVFDRNGAVISRYRKWNLFGEYNMNTTLKPEYAIFDTDFGVRFGHFICFDIIFKTPALDLVSRGITDIIFTTMWFSELPFLTAVQYQAAWSYANDVNLLAAGANNVARGSTGTGIYAAKNGALVSVMRTEGEQKLYVAVVPKKGTTVNSLPKRNETHVSDGQLFLKRDKIDNYTTSLINLTEKSISKKLCYQDLCCNFGISLGPRAGIPNEKFYIYRLAIYNGRRSYNGAAEGTLKVCGLLACLDETMESCGRVFNNTSTVENTFVFESIKIEGNFKDSREMLIMPNSLDFSLMPLNVNEFYFKVDTRTQAVRYELIKPKSNLLTFAIYANVYGGGSAVLILNSFVLMVSVLTMLLWPVNFIN